MRKVERELKQRQAKLPEDKKKVDTSVNGDAERLVEEHREVEKRLYPLRIDHRTVIYVTKDKCTKGYAEKIRRRFGAVPKAERKGGNARVAVNIEEVRTLVQNGMHLKDIARQLLVSKTTVDKYIKKYDLRNGDEKKY